MSAAVATSPAPHPLLVQLAQTLKSARMRATTLSRQGQNDQAMPLLATIDQIELEARTARALAPDDEASRQFRVLLARAQAIVVPASQDEWVTPEEAAQQAHISRAAMSQWIKQGKVTTRPSKRKNGVMILLTSLPAAVTKTKVVRPAKAPQTAVAATDPTFTEPHKLQSYRTVASDTKWWCEYKPQPDMMNRWIEAPQ